MADNKNVSRRSALKTGGLLAAASAAGFAGLFAGSEDALAAPKGPRIKQLQDAKDDIATIVSLAATAEALASTAYYATIAQAGFSIDSDDLEYLKFAMTAELYHLNFLQSAGGKMLASEFYVPATFLSSMATNVQTFIAAETAFIGAYLAATRRMAELGQPRLAATTAQHAASEMEHLALIREIGGFVPNPNALPAPIYYNVSDAVPTLTPFLKGGNGFIGPVKFPGADAINALAGDAKAKAVPVFLNVF